MNHNIWSEELLCDGPRNAGTVNYRWLEPHDESSTCVPVTTMRAAGTLDTGQLPCVGRGGLPSRQQTCRGLKGRQGGMRQGSLFISFPRIVWLSPYGSLSIVFSPTT